MEIHLGHVIRQRTGDRRNSDNCNTEMELLKSFRKRIVHKHKNLVFAIETVPRKRTINLPKNASPGKAHGDLKSRRIGPSKKPQNSSAQIKQHQTFSNETCASEAAYTRYYCLS